MPRIDVPFVVEKQNITQPTREVLISGGKNYFYATFIINEIWEDITGLKAVFVTENVSKLVELAETEEGFECQIPWEVMANKGTFQVGIFGGDRLLTNYAYVVVKQGCVTDGEYPAPPTEDWFGKVDKEISELEVGKADKINTYTKTETADVVDREIKSALSSYYTETEVKDYVDEQTEIIKVNI